MNRYAKKNKTTPANQLRDPLADRIRMIYILERDELEATFHRGNSDYRPGPWWDGGRCRSGKVRRSIWQLIARRLQDAKVDDPGDYVRFVFDEARIPPPCPPESPKPNHLLSQRHLDEYRRGFADRRHNLIRNLRINLGGMANTLRLCFGWYEDCKEMVAEGELDWEGEEPSGMEIAANVLLDTSTQMNELFRFCVAVECCPQLAGRFEHMAAYKYVPIRDAYDTAWGKFIPDTFRRQADKLYHVACQRLLRGR